MGGLRDIGIINPAQSPQDAAATSDPHQSNVLSRIVSNFRVNTAISVRAAADDEFSVAIGGGAAVGSAKNPHPQRIAVHRRRELVTSVLESWWMLCPFMAWAILVISFYTGVKVSGDYVSKGTFASYG